MPHWLTQQTQPTSSIFDWLDQHATAIGALNAILMVVVTVALAVFTYWLYRTAKEESRTTRKALDVAMQHFELEWYPELHVLLFNGACGDSARLTNLGRSAALLLGLHLRPKSSNESEYFEISEKKVIRPAEPVDQLIRFALEQYGHRTNHFNSNEDTMEHFAISFSFRGAGRNLQTQWFVFPLRSKAGRTDIDYQKLAEENYPTTP